VAVKVRERSLELLRLMSDGAAWEMGALVRALGWSRQAVARHLLRLLAGGEVEAIHVKRARAGSIEVVEAYRITQRGLQELGGGATGGLVEPPPDAPAVKLAAYILSWSKYATRTLLHLSKRGEDSMNELRWAMGAYRSRVGNKPSVWSVLLKLREWGLIEWELLPSGNPRYQRRYRFRITERGLEVARAILAVAGELLAGEEQGAPSSATS
jgi:DNA-binding PadR family transcriptional regulator